MASSLRPLTRLLLTRSTLIARRPLSTSILAPSRRPLLSRPHSLLTSSHDAAAQRRSMFIQTETTPNPDSLKFVPGVDVLPPRSSSMEFLDGRSAHAAPLAKKLFAVDGVRSVFYGPNFITVTKASEVQWPFLKAEVFSLITEALAAGGTAGVINEGESRMAADTAAAEGDTEVVSMIKELLDTRIRPSIMEDGGDIEYRGFDEAFGEVKLKLRGACRTCDSSTVTLKNGIESMLKHYIEEVKTVTQVLDEEEEIAVREFERFEEKLKKVKRPDTEKCHPVLDTAS